MGGAGGVHPAAPGRHGVRAGAGQGRGVLQYALHHGGGGRPGRPPAAGPDVAIPLYEQFLNSLESQLGKQVGSGEFGAMMEVELLNDGPVTLILDTP